MIPDSFQLLAARTMLRLTVRQVAAALGASTRTVVDIESGSVDPRRTTLERLYDLYVREGAEFSQDGWVRLAPEKAKARSREMAERRQQRLKPADAPAP